MRTTLQSAPVLGDIINALGPQALLASFSATGFGIQNGLSVDQWQQEVHFWFAVKPARLQKAFLDLSGPDAKMASISIHLPDNVASRICKDHVRCSL